MGRRELIDSVTKKKWGSPIISKATKTARRKFILPEELPVFTNKCRPEEYNVS